MAFARRGCDVFAVEPDSSAVTIGKMKARRAGVDPDRFSCNRGEDLPFSSGTFDVVWCYTVLEHVHSVEACVSEMVRVVRPLGRVFIMAPDYRQFYEPHYKITMPMFFPKRLLRLWLRLLGRPVDFFDTLRFISSRMLANMFQDLPVTAFQVYHPWPEEWKSKASLSMRLIKTMTRILSIQRDQCWVLQKLKAPCSISKESTKK